MKHLPVIFITLSIILSVIACILPNWATMMVNNTTTPSISQHTSTTKGLFTECVTINNKSTCCSNNINNSKLSGILAVKIFSIASSLLLVIGAVLCSMNTKKKYVVATLLVGIGCLLATLIIFATTTLSSIFPNCTDINTATQTLKCPALSTCWYLELGAIILAIVGVVSKYSQKK